MFVPPEGHHKRLKLRDAVRYWLMKDPGKFEISVTLNFNRDISWDAARDKLGEWAQRVDRTYLGNGYRKRPNDRALFVAFFENEGTNSHLHTLERLPLVPWHRLIMPKFRNYQTLKWHIRTLTKHWVKLVKSGSVDVKRIYDVEGIVQYNTKQLSRRSSIEHFVLSSEFHSSPKPSPAAPRGKSHNRHH